MRRPHIALVLLTNDLALTGAAQPTMEDKDSIISLRYESNSTPSLIGQKYRSPRSKSVFQRIRFVLLGRHKDWCGGDDDDDYHDNKYDDSDGDDDDEPPYCSNMTPSNTRSLSSSTTWTTSTSSYTTSTSSYTITTTATTPTPTSANSQSTYSSDPTIVSPTQEYTGANGAEATPGSVHDNDKDSRTTVNTAAGVAGGIGALLILVLLLFACYWFVVRRRRRQQLGMTPSKESNIESLANTSPQLASQHPGGGSGSGSGSVSSNNSSSMGLSSHGMPMTQSPPISRAELYSNNGSLERLPGMPPPAAMSQTSFAEAYAAQYGQIQQPHAYSPLMSGMRVTPGFLPPGSSHSHYNHHHHHALAPLHMAATPSHPNLGRSGPPDPFDDRPPPPRYPDAIATSQPQPHSYPQSQPYVHHTQSQAQAQAQQQRQQEPRTQMPRGTENMNMNSTTTTTPAQTSPILPVSPLSPLSPSPTALEDDAHIVPGGPPSHPQTHLYRGPRQPDHGYPPSSSCSSSSSSSNLPEGAIAAVSPLCPQTGGSPPNYDESAESEAAAARGFGAHGHGHGHGYGGGGDTKQAPPSSREPMSRY